MDRLLSWQNLIFYIPLAAGLLLVAGAALSPAAGETDSDGDLDADADADADADVDADGDVDADADAGLDADADGADSAYLPAGLAQLPLTLVMVIALFLFGAIGVIMNTLAGALFAAPTGLLSLVPVVVAVLGTLALTARVSRLIGRVLPLYETSAAPRRHLVGRLGVVVQPAGPSAGLAQVYDAEGNLHQVPVRSEPGSLAKGTPILLVDYDAARDVFCAVAVSPTPEGGSQPGEPQ